MKLAGNQPINKSNAANTAAASITGKLDNLITRLILLHAGQPATEGRLTK